LPLSELALDDERRRLTTPRNDGRWLPDLLECAEREASLLLLLRVDGDRKPLGVDGRDSDFGADFLLDGDIERRSQPTESRSLDEDESVDMTSSDIDEFDGWRRLMLYTRMRLSR
jgi:hypothetical protein